MNKKTRPFSDFLNKEVQPPKKLISKKPSVAVQAKTKENTKPKKAAIKSAAKPIAQEGNPQKGLIARFLDKELHKHPFAVPVITITLLSFVTMIGLVFTGSSELGSNDSHVVQLSVDDEKIVLPTKALTVKDFLERSKVTIKEGDVVEPALDTQIEDDDFRINVYRAQQVTIVDGTKRIQALSAATTPRSIAAQAGVRVYAEDKIELTDPQQALRNQVLGAELVITRSIPVNLNLYGKAVSIRTHAGSISELLVEKNIALSKDDQVLPAADAKLTEGMQVFITRLGVKIETVEEVINNKEEIVEDSSLSFGTTALRQAGSPGQKLVTYEVTLENGKEISRKVIQEVVAKDPVTKITVRGRAVSIPEDKTAWMSAAGISESDYPYVNYILSREANWCPTIWQGQIGYCPAYYEPLHSESSGFGFGLCQSTPAIKMASAGDDWRTNAITQLKWCSNYAQGRYGGWEGAYNFWTVNHWW
jgi:uncharacterized protein YabE (DUF348 family)